ncbi:acyltransferase [Deinococcus metalli]|uniref:Acyltransferase n=1 Tax=Deinococcus metalli TaxID=1141878 RepID=A0ABQ3JIA4_9DEIO|nr:acyltransferase [Deinococcus metalli]
MLWHFALLFEAGTPFDRAAGWVHLLRVTPLNVLIGGHQAVLVFFILSGFVLTLMLTRGGGMPYGPYVWRRVTRLYLPYITVILIAAALNVELYHGRLPEFGLWINQFWHLPISLGVLLNHVGFVGPFNTDQFDYAIWSLVHEMRISLLFPLLLAAVLKLGWRRSVVAAGLLSVAVTPLYHLTIARHPNVATSLLTLHYLLPFTVGTLLALHLRDVQRWYAARGRTERVVLAVAAVVSYFVSSLPQTLWGLDTPMILEWLALPGATLLLVFALASDRVGRLLAVQPAPFLGRISYSLYLTHPVTMLATLHLLHGRLPVALLPVIGLALTVPVATLVYWAVEQPSIRLGHRVAAWTSRRPGLEAG